MPELLPPCAPLYPWLLDRCYRNLRVVRNPADPFSLRHDGQEVEIARRSTDLITDIDIMLIRCDGPPNDRWVSWRRSADYRVDLLHFATRAVVLDALADIGHTRPWALGRCWSSLTDEQAARVVGAIVRAVGADPKRPASVVPTGVLGPWVYRSEPDWARTAHFRLSAVGHGTAGVIDAGPHWSAEHTAPFHGWYFGETAQYPYWKDHGYPIGPEIGNEGRCHAEAVAIAKGAILWEQITPELRTVPAPDQPDASAP